MKRELMADLTGGGGEVWGASSAVRAVEPPAGAGARARVLMGGLVMGPRGRSLHLPGRWDQLLKQLPSPPGGPARGAVSRLACVLVGDLGSGSRFVGGRAALRVSMTHRGERRRRFFR